MSAVMRAALSELAQIDPMGDDLPENYAGELASEVNRIAREAMGRADLEEFGIETARLRTALQKIVDGYGPNHGSKYCWTVAEEALAT